MCNHYAVHLKLVELWMSTVILKSFNLEKDKEFGIIMQVLLTNKATMVLWMWERKEELLESEGDLKMLHQLLSKWRKGHEPSNACGHENLG